MKHELPTQATANWNDPEEHVSWALRAMPSYAGVGQITAPEFLRRWSRHLVEVGFAHVDYLRTLADADGNIHVSRLPKQRIKWQEPMRGQRTVYNPAGQWVPMNRPEPPKMRIPDLRQFTQQEQQGMLAQARALGLLPDNTPKPMVAQVVD